VPLQVGYQVRTECQAMPSSCKSMNPLTSMSPVAPKKDAGGFTKGPAGSSSRMCDQAMFLPPLIRHLNQYLILLSLKGSSSATTIGIVAFLLVNYSRFGKL